MGLGRPHVLRELWGRGALQLGRIGYANGVVPGGYAHVSSPRVSGRFEESGRDSEQHVE